MKFKWRYIFVIILLVVFLLQLEKVQASVMFAYSLLIISQDFKNFQVKRFDVSTAYAILLIVTSVSHLIALFGWSDNPWFFNTRYSATLSGKAIFIFNLGSVLLMESIRSIIDYKGDSRNTTGVLKRLTFGRVFFISLLMFALSVNYKGLILSLGSFGSFFLIMINGSVLLLSFIAHSSRKNVLIVIAYTLFLTAWTIQYSYLRMEIVIPLIAYLGGDMLANRSLLKMHFYSKVLVVISLLIFPPIFTYLGENRSALWGRQKLEQAFETIGSNPDVEGQTIMSRLSIIPQVSQIIMLTEKKGFFEGQTLSYLGYVFIPRFLWPDKPLIKQGQWFALEIGAAYQQKDGRINNSVNMTVPGEFYLNYGFSGVIVGCIIFGLFIGWLWNQTSYQTIYGWAFRFYLIFLGLFSLGADLQIIPTLIAYWIIYKLLMVSFGMRSKPYKTISRPRFSNIQ